MARNLMLFTFAEAAKAGPYDERPMLPDSLDLQIHLSKNTVPQPFHLICQHDTVLFALSGSGQVEYKDASVLRHSYTVGDHLYVPAGVPHRIMPTSETIQYRYKLPESELEAIAWYCESCGNELYREVWQLKQELAQEAYPRIARAFNAEAQRRTCVSCGTVHPEIDLGPFRWEDVARLLKEENTQERAKASA
jgi:mannose-6-phosphate isomerase-like protein (cupin superfamily)